MGGGDAEGWRLSSNGWAVVIHMRCRAYAENLIVMFRIVFVWHCIIVEVNRLLRYDSILHTGSTLLKNMLTKIGLDPLKDFSRSD